MTRKELLRALEETLGAPNPQRSSAAWAGFYGALAGGPINREVSQGWPYRTTTAEVLWKYAKDLIPKHPELDEMDILKKAVEVSGVDPLDLTPEDWRLLEMAIEWRKAGSYWQKRPRIGGSTPGGPFDSRYAGRYLPKRGAP